MHKSNSTVNAGKLLVVVGRVERAYNSTPVQLIQENIMPLIHGEGAENAFKRLREDIDKHLKVKCGFLVRVRVNTT